MPPATKGLSHHPMSTDNIKLTPMLRQFQDIKEQHPDKLVLFRMGDFYETFFEDARQASKILNITLTTRNKNDPSPVPMAGFPYHALDTYLDKLVQSGIKVAICEQVEDPKEAVGLVKRKVVEIITPGTVLDNALISDTASVYLACVYFENPERGFGVARLDLSTGEFAFTQLPAEELLDELARIKPAEIVVNDIKSEEYIKGLNLDYEPSLTIFDSWQFKPKEAALILKEHFKVTSLEAYGAHNKPLGSTAAGAALAYVQSLYQVPLDHISTLNYYSLSSYMQLDEISRRNLELTHSIRYNTKHGSLLSVIDQTRTPMGSRLLQNWLLHPLLDVMEIVRRQEVIQAFMDNTAYLNDLRTTLRDIGDIARLVSRLGSLRINPREVLALSNFLYLAQELVAKLRVFRLPDEADYIAQLSGFEEMANLIETAIVEKPPLTVTEGGIFQKGFNEELDELLTLIHDGKSWIARLEEDERQKTGIPSLKVGYNKVFGYYIEVSAAHKDKVPDYYLAKQTLVNSQRYVSPRLKEYEAKVLSAEEKIKNLEHELFRQMRIHLAQDLDKLQALGETIARIDVFSALAWLAWQNHYCRPVFSDERSLVIEEGRHPVIEKLMESEDFIPNSTLLDYPQTSIALITGPNMAGKSTYLRQVGLLVIMAQIGSWVPAQKMVMPIFDRVFTRVGASDNLAQGQSTFLVEMIETANILNSASKQSLVLLDEIGRGTSTFDGLSLAWAIIEYINKHTGSLTLFATHYHELTELEYLYPEVKNYNVAVKEYKDQMIFLRRIERGAADQSYGIQVARLAGIPKRVIRRAKEILKNLEEHEISARGRTATLRKKLEQNPQVELFEVMLDKAEEQEPYLDKIRELDLDEMTPIEAWQFLKDMQDEL